MYHEGLVEMSADCKTERLAERKYRALNLCA